MGDIVIFPKFKIYVEKLEEVLQRLSKAHLKLKPNKCKLFTSQIHVVSAAGVSTEKVETVKECDPPT